MKRERIAKNRIEWLIKQFTLSYKEFKGIFENEQLQNELYLIQEFTYFLEDETDESHLIEQIERYKKDRKEAQIKYLEEKLKKLKAK